MDVSIKEAAERLGVSVDTVRRRLKAGELEGRREPHGKSGYRWLVQLPDDAQASAPGMPLAEAYELADARARIEGLERLIDELATDRDAWKQQAERAQTLIQQAQSLALALPAQVEPVDVAQGSQRPADAPHGATPARGVSERLRRWIAGGGSAPQIRHYFRFVGTTDSAKAFALASGSGRGTTSSSVATIRDEFARLTGPREGTLRGCGRARKAGSASSPTTPPSNEWWVTRGYRDALSQHPPQTSG